MNDDIQIEMRVTLSKSGLILKWLNFKSLDSSFIITDLPKKSPHVSCYVEMKIFDTLKQNLSGVQLRRFMGTCFDQYATMTESWVHPNCLVFIVTYAEYLSHGKGIPPGYFDAETFRTRYASLLCKHGTQKNEIGAVSDDESTNQSVRPQFECESSDMIIIP
ncbi:hypothetical protein T459_15966 [Capsicum annuum]|uniref:Uncharacterized protein n=1 Tax=Capsicum annuum TaxID=4072 RepID=A0A2G2Z7H8_CAPAN|nr:hypothetical protein T459_15966 [Capsicum annuum]